mgnify:FL=1
MKKPLENRLKTSLGRDKAQKMEKARKEAVFASPSFV